MILQSIFIIWIKGSFISLGKLCFTIYTFCSCRLASLYFHQIELRFSFGGVHELIIFSLLNKPNSSHIFRFESYIDLIFLKLYSNKAYFLTLAFILGIIFFKPKLKLGPRFLLCHILFLLSVMQSQKKKITGTRKEKRNRKIWRKNNHSVRIKHKKN